MEITLIRDFNPCVANQQSRSWPRRKRCEQDWLSSS